MRNSALKAFVATLATLAAVVPASGRQGEELAPSAFLVKASISTAGRYGESWYLTLAPDGEANLQVFYSTSPSGTLLTRFSLAAEHVLAVRETLESEDFFALPPQLAPSEPPMHRPRLVVEVYLGGRHHTVSALRPREARESAYHQPLSRRLATHLRSAALETVVVERVLQNKALQQTRSAPCRTAVGVPYSLTPV